IATSDESHKLSPGEQVTVAVRPEFVQLHPVGSSVDGNLNRLDGTVLSTSHLGETVQFLVDLGNGVSLQSRLPTPSAPKLREGDAAIVTFAPDSVQFFPIEPTDS